MTGFTISDLAAGAGRIGISPMPGRFGDYQGDIALIRDWQADLVLTMTEMAELRRMDAADLGADLAGFGCDWLHFPVPDLSAPSADALFAWPTTVARVRDVLAKDGRVLVHCFGGCGRSGMAIVRILREMGEEPQTALARLRAVRACAVETEDQMNWATG